MTRLFFKKFKRASVRKILRSYFTLTKANNRDFFYRVSERIYSTELEPPRSNFPHHFAGETPKEMELIVRQLLIRRILNRRLFKTILYFSPELIFPVPREWRKIFGEAGLKTKNRLSRFIWVIFLLSLGAFGVARSAKEIYSALVSKQWGNQAAVSFFFGLPATAVPRQAHLSGHTFIHWYCKNFGKINHSMRIRHCAFKHKPIEIAGYSIEGMNNSLPPISLSKALWLTIWALWKLIDAIKDLTRGNWWSIFLLHELVLAKKITLIKQTDLPAKFYFSHEFCLYKPLWVYEAEKRGVTSYIFFYSTNSRAIEAFDDKYYPPLAPKIASWTNYIAWNRSHKDLLTAEHSKNPLANKIKITVISPVTFVDSGAKMPPVQKKTLAVFDVSPARLSFFATLGLPQNYYIAENVCAFLKDIETSRKNIGFNVVFKTKRDTTKIHATAYLRLIEKLEKLGWTIIDPEIGAATLIEECEASVHLPFTSTIHIADQLRRPATYYDPTGIVSKNDVAAMGALVINRRKELVEFLSLHF